MNYCDHVFIRKKKKKALTVACDVAFESECCASGFGNMLTVVMCKCTKNFFAIFLNCETFFFFFFLFCSFLTYLKDDVCLRVCACGSQDVHLNEAEPNFCIVFVRLSLSLKLFSELKARHSNLLLNVRSSLEKEARRPELHFGFLLSKCFT